MTVYDEDKDHKVEFLGKVAIPLLKIRNNEKRWYALKDKKLRSRAKGNSPQILLEMQIIWNPVSFELILRTYLSTIKTEFNDRSILPIKKSLQSQLPKKYQ